MLRRIAAIAASLILALPAAAQDSRGSITGKVIDPQGGLIPAAQIAIVNLDRNETHATATNGTGYYEVNALMPGMYRITAEAPGFKKQVRGNIELQVGGRLDIEMQLQIGQTSESVEVTAETPLLDTTSASGGRVIDTRQIMQLPFSDMNPFALATLAPGMQWTGQPEYRRPFDNGGTSSFNTAGGVGSNEYTIDGAPVTGTGRRVGFVPPSDAVDEFKLETTPFDASIGHTSGAAVNVMTKAGTNTYHGSMYDQHWQQRWNATQHFTRLAFEDAVRRGTAKPDDQRQAPGRSNNFGATAGGAIKIPKLYDGKDKLFFFGSYNGIYQSKAETTDAINRTVPAPEWLNGDFSALQKLDAVKYTVYDPRSARLENGRVTRTPFPENKGIPTLNPLAKFYLPVYPKPNNVPGLVSPEGFRNYLALALPKNEKFNSLIQRTDYNINQRHRVFGRWYWNHRLADEYDWTYETKRGLNTNGLTRINKGGGGSYTWTIGNNTVLDAGVSWTRFNEGSERPVQTAYKPTDVGLPAYLDTRASANHTLPRINFNNIESIGDSYPAISARGTTGEAKINMTTVFGAHSLKYGVDERRYQYTSSGPGNSSGSFSFSNSYMRATDSTSTASNHGLEFAAFLMGLPSGIGIDTNDSGFWTTPYRSFYVQDDWRLSSKLRLAIGLRYEWEGGIRERYNRGIAGGFNFGQKLPFSDLVSAAYAKNPIPELPASQFNPIGGVSYLGTNGSDTYTNGTHSFLPRIGATYSANSKTVIKGGWGTFVDTLNVNNTQARQDGYSQSTGTILTSDNGLTFCCGLGSISGLSASKNPLTDPFPVRADGTRFSEPYGNSLGAVIMAGRGVGTLLPRDYRPAFQHRWRFGVQREIRRDIVVEVSYNGAFARIPVGQRIDYLPSQYWASGNTRNQAVDDSLNANVANPFNLTNLTDVRSSNPTLYNYLSTVGLFNSTTIRRNQLLRPFPYFNGSSGLRPGVDFGDSRGNVTYADWQAQVEKRFSKGFTTTVLYTNAYSDTKDFYANEFDTQLSSRPSTNVRRNRFVWSAIYELPFGKGKQFATHGPLQHIVGGWQLSWIYQYQTGQPTGWGNRFFYGDVNQIGDLLKHDQVNGKDIHQWFDPAITFTGQGAIPSSFNGFEGRSANQPGSYQTRVFPTRLDSLNEDGIRNWDVKVQRRFHVYERLNTSLSVDLLNATNHTNFSGPNTDPTNRDFGKVTSQRGLSRIIQLNLRIDF